MRILKSMRFGPQIILVNYFANPCTLLYSVHTTLLVLPTITLTNPSLKCHSLPTHHNTLEIRQYLVFIYIYTVLHRTSWSGWSVGWRGIQEIERLTLTQTQNTSPKVKPWAKVFHYIWFTNPPTQPKLLGHFRKPWRV